MLKGKIGRPCNMRDKKSYSAGNICDAYAYVQTASVVYWSEFLAAEQRCIVFPVRYELNLYMLCRRK
jgi:hypothetical protein